MSHELLKVIVQPVLIERNADGQIIGEKLGQPAPLYEQSDVAAFFDDVRAGIAALDQEVEHDEG